MVVTAEMFHLVAQVLVRVVAAVQVEVELMEVVGEPELRVKVLTAVLLAAAAVPELLLLAIVADVMAV